MNIIINGKKREISEQIISYREVVRMAYPEDREGKVFTVAFRRARPSFVCGTMTFGDRFTVTEGMIFNVMQTGAA